LRPRAISAEEARSFGGICTGLRWQTGIGNRGEWGAVRELILDESERTAIAHKYFQGLTLRFRKISERGSKYHGARGSISPSNGGGLRHLNDAERLRFSSLFVRRAAQHDGLLQGAAYSGTSAENCYDRSLRLLTDTAPSAAKDVVLRVTRLNKDDSVVELKNMERNIHSA
jgi:hypothetical protein